MLTHELLAITAASMLKVEHGHVITDQDMMLAILTAAEIITRTGKYVEYIQSRSLKDNQPPEGK